MMNRYILSLLLVLAFVSISAAQSGIRNIGFKNFTYNAHCLGEEPENVTVKNGEFSEEKQEDGYVDRFYFKVFDISYGDLTGDKQDEAVVLTVCNTGGTGNFSEGFVFALKSGKPSLIARIPGGDRAYGGLRETRVENGLLVVESNEVGEQGGACCPEFVVTTKYRVSNGKIFKLGTPARRPLTPTTRITFARGTSGKTISFKLPAGETFRYVVGAEAGQRLSVSINTDQAKLELVEDAEITTGINNFLARLPKSGDYTIEVISDTNVDVQITLNIKIN